MLERIEQNIFGHFKYLPRLFRFDVQKTPQITVINNDLGSPLFNIVFDTHLEAWARLQKDAYHTNHTNTSARTFNFWAFFFPFFYTRFFGTKPHRDGEEFIKAYVDKIIQGFNGQPFYWIIGPSCNPKWLKQLLFEKGFNLKKTQRSVVYDPHKETMQDEIISRLRINSVEDEDGLQDFLSVIQEKDPGIRRFYNNLKFPITHLNEKLFVGYDRKIPVAVATIYIENNTIGIFNLWCKEHISDCETYRLNMAQYLLHYAQQRKIDCISLLTANTVEHHLYEALGFKEVAQFECLEWKPA